VKLLLKAGANSRAENKVRIRGRERGTHAYVIEIVWGRVQKCIASARSFSCVCAGVA